MLTDEIIQMLIINKSAFWKVVQSIFLVRKLPSLSFSSNTIFIYVFSQSPGLSLDFTLYKSLYTHTEIFICLHWTHWTLNWVCTDFMLGSHSMAEMSNQCSRSTEFILHLFIHVHFLLRTAEFASNVEREPAGNGTTPACCVRTVSKIRTLLCAVQCVPAFWTLSTIKT